jgi:hypothetical protein
LEMWDKFMKDGTFIMAFIVVTILVSTFAPDMLFYVLVLILLGQILMNSDTLVTLLEKTGLTKPK